MGGNRYRNNRGGNFRNTPDRSQASTPGRQQYGRSGIAHFSFAGYGITDEATPSWKFASNLWKRPVVFISAGSSIPIEDPKTLEEKQQAHLREIHTAVQEELKAEEHHLSELAPVPATISLSTSTSEPAHTPATTFPYSFTSHSSVFPVETPAHDRPVSPSPSVSSTEELIIFRGRKSAVDLEQAPKQLATSSVVVADEPSAIISKVPVPVSRDTVLGSLNGTKSNPSQATPPTSKSSKSTSSYPEATLSSASTTKRAFPILGDKPVTVLEPATGHSEPKQPFGLDEITLAVQDIINSSAQDLDSESSPAIDKSPEMVKPSHRRTLRREARHRKKQRKSGGNQRHLVKALKVIDVYGDFDEDQSESDLMMKDYMDNMAENGDEFFPTSWSRRDLGGEEGDIFIGDSTDNESINPDVDDDDEFGSADDKDDRSADQHLNLALRQTAAQDVMPASTENNDSDTPDVVNTPSGNDTPDKAENAVDEIGIDAGLLDEYDDEEDEEDEEGDRDDDIISDNAAGLNDQEEDDEEEDEDIDEDADFFSQDIISVFPRQSFKKKGKNSVFALASSRSLVPDLDEVMSHTCAGKKRKGKGAIPFFDQDLQPDLQDIMLKSMNTNRAKKAEKKRQRELLRSQGILGRDKDDLAVKYPTGMTYKQIADELWAFISADDQEELNLPSMSSDYRKGVHELARHSNLISKSTGKGDDRRPVIYKKGYETIARRRFENVVDRIGKRYFRSSYSGGNPGRKFGDKPKGSITSGSHSTRYMEGEIIGGSLPHIGTENRGHELLKKMGWSRGTALGSTENKGILEPVMQKMKNSRAGLG